MFNLFEHCYRVGPSALMVLTADQVSASWSICPGVDEDNSTHERFFHLFKDGVMFHCTTKQQEKSARNDTVCFFQQDNEVIFGIITLFVHKPVPIAIIRVTYPKQQSLMDQAGQPGKESLRIH